MYFMNMLYQSQLLVVDLTANHTKRTTFTYCSVSFHSKGVRERFRGGSIQVDLRGQRVVWTNG